MNLDPQTIIYSSSIWVVIGKYEFFIKNKHVDSKPRHKNCYLIEITNLLRL